MNPIVKDVIKNTLVMFAVGLVLAAVAPMIASGMGAAGMIGSGFAADIVAKATMSEIVWTGAFFGAFGGIHAALGPAFNAVFPDKDKAAPSSAGEKPHASSPAVHLQLAPEASQEVLSALSSKHRDQVSKSEKPYAGRG